MPSKFKVKVTDSEASDPCVGITLTAEEDESGLIPPGLYDIKGSILIEEEDGSNALEHPFPPAEIKCPIRLNRNYKGKKFSIPFHDRRYVKHGENKAAYLTVILEERCTGYLYPILTDFRLTTRASFPPGSGYYCQRG